MRGVEGVCTLSALAWLRLVAGAPVSFRSSSPSMEPCRPDPMETCHTLPPTSVSLSASDASMPAASSPHAEALSPCPVGVTAKLERPPTPKVECDRLRCGVLGVPALGHGTELLAARGGLLPSAAKLWLLPLAAMATARTGRLLDCKSTLCALGFPASRCRCTARARDALFSSVVMREYTLADDASLRKPGEEALGCTCRACRCRREAGPAEAGRRACCVLLLLLLLLPWRAGGVAAPRRPLNHRGGSIIVAACTLLRYYPAANCTHCSCRCKWDPS